MCYPSRSDWGWRQPGDRKLWLSFWGPCWDSSDWWDQNMSPFLNELLSRQERVLQHGQWREVYCCGSRRPAGDSWPTTQVGNSTKREKMINNKHPRSWTQLAATVRKGRGPRRIEVKRKRVATIQSFLSTKFAISISPDWLQIVFLFSSVKEHYVILPGAGWCVKLETRRQTGDRFHGRGQRCRRSPCGEMWHRQL